VVSSDCAWRQWQLAGELERKAPRAFAGDSCLCRQTPSRSRCGLFVLVHCLQSSPWLSEQRSKTIWSNIKWFKERVNIQQLLCANGSHSRVLEALGNGPTTVNVRFLMFSSMSFGHGRLFASDFGFKY
jgi:hypothetical protein